MDTSIWNPIWLLSQKLGKWSSQYGPAMRWAVLQGQTLVENRWDGVSLQARENVPFAEIQASIFSAFDMPLSGSGFWGKAWPKLLFSEYIRFLLASSLIFPCLNPAFVISSGVSTQYIGSVGQFRPLITHNILDDSGVFTAANMAADEARCQLHVFRAHLEWVLNYGIPTPEKLQGTSLLFEACSLCRWTLELKSFRTKL